MTRTPREIRGSAREAAGRAARTTKRLRPGALPADRAARRDARRLELLGAAIEVIRREGPGASMDQMAAAAGVTKPILYRHFGDRAGLVDAISAFSLSLLDATLDDVLRADVAPRELVASAIDAYLRFVESEPEVYRFLVQRAVPETGSAATIDDFVGQISRRIAVVLGEGLRAGGSDSGPAEVWAYGMVGMVHVAGDWWLRRRSLPRARVCEYLTRLVCDGLPDIDTLGPTSTWLPPDVIAVPPRIDLGPAGSAIDDGDSGDRFDLLGSAGTSTPARSARSTAPRRGSGTSRGAGNVHTTHLDGIDPEEAPTGDRDAVGTDGGPSGSRENGGPRDRSAGARRTAAGGRQARHRTESHAGRTGAPAVADPTGVPHRSTTTTTTATTRRKP